MQLHKQDIVAAGFEVYTKKLYLQYKNTNECVCFQILGYVAEIFSCLQNSTRDELRSLEEELKKDVPESLHSLLEKQNKEEATQKYLQRKGKTTAIVPPTCTGRVIVVSRTLFKPSLNVEGNPVQV